MYRPRMTTPFVCMLAVALGGFCATAQATPITISTSQGEFTPGTPNQGWWSNGGGHSNTNANYFVGETGGSEYRNFFTFDLSSLTGTVTSATLQLQGTRRCASPNATESYGLFDVSTASSTLSTSNGPDTGIFDDLGTGTSYGVFNVNMATCNNTLSFTLNAAAISAINAAIGGYFSIGGALQDLNGTSDQYLFGFSGGPQNLILDTASVPEPGSLGMFGLGMAGLGLIFLNRRRRARA